MKKNVVLFCLLISFFSCAERSQKEIPSKYLDSQSNPVIEAFFQKIQVGKYQKAVPELLSTNPNIDLEDSATIGLERKFDAINEQSGRFVSKRLLKERKLGDDVGVYSYLVKYDKKFYRFVFTFYNNGTLVEIFKFSFDDNINLELEEAIKLYMN